MAGENQGKVEAAGFGGEKCSGPPKIKNMFNMLNDNNRNDNNDKDINNIDRIIDRNDNDSIDSRNESNSLLMKEKLLARDLAAGLDDKANLGFYLSVCRKYPERVLRGIYSQVKEIPSSKIRKSRGALFNYLIQKHDKKNS